MKTLKIILDFLQSILTNKVSVWLIIILLGGGNAYQFFDPFTNISQTESEEHEHDEYATKHSHPYEKLGHNHPVLDKMAKDHGYTKD